MYFTNYNLVWVLAQNCQNFRTYNLNIVLWYSINKYTIPSWFPYSNWKNSHLGPEYSYSCFSVILVIIENWLIEKTWIFPPKLKHFVVHNEIKYNDNSWTHNNNIINKQTKITKHRNTNSIKFILTLWGRFSVCSVSLINYGW